MTWIAQVLVAPGGFTGAVQVGVRIVVELNVPFDGRPVQTADHVYPSVWPRVSAAVTERFAVAPEATVFGVPAAVIAGDRTPGQKL